MTNQEAIEIIRSAQAQIEWSYPMNYAVAFDMAISALQTRELSETQKALDTISRQAAIDTATEYEKQLREILGDENELAETVKILKHRIIALPPAQPEIVRCKDCKECWHSGTATIREKICEIYKCKFWDDRIVSQNGYCYMAERRADGLGDS